MIFGYRGNTHLHSKKDRLSKDCFIEKFFGTQPYMQIPVMDTSISGHKQCLYIQFAWHLLNTGTLRCILNSLWQSRRWAVYLTAQGWSKDRISTYIYWKHDIVIFQILSIFVTESTGISRDLPYTWSQISGYQILHVFRVWQHSSAFLECRKHK